MANYTIASSLILFTACLYGETAPAPLCDFCRETTRASVSHIEGKGIGYDKGYTSLELFLAPGLERSSAFPFLDLRGHVFDDGRLAFNTGAGFRGLVSKRVYGANIYYDYRQTHHGHFNQVGVGLESLGIRWDFRLNGYLPVGDKDSRLFHPRFGKFVGNDLYVKRTRESAMSGADGEAGMHLRPLEKLNFYAGAGPYYFEGGGRNMWGGKARIDAYYKDYLSLELSGSYDDLFHGIVQGTIALNLPLGAGSKLKPRNTRCPISCCDLQILSGRMVQPVNREEIIVLDRRHKYSVAIDPLTGLPYHFIFVDNLHHSAGTIESPYPDFDTALSVASAGDVIYVFPGDGIATGLTGNYQLQDNQRVIGAGTPYTIGTTLGSIVIPALAAQMPLFTGIDPTLPVISLGNNNTFSGLHLLGVGDSGLFAYPACLGSFSPIDRLTVLNNYFETLVGADGINIAGTSGAMLFKGNTFNLQTDAVNGGGAGVGISLHEGQFSTYGIARNTFTGNLDMTLGPSAGISIILSNTSFPSDVTCAITNNTFSYLDLGVDVDFDASIGVFHVNANSFENILKNDLGNDGAIHFHSPSDDAQASIQVANNNIINAAGAGINIVSDGSGSMNADVIYNAMTNCNNGIHIYMEDVAAINIRNNWISDDVDIGIWAEALNGGSFNAVSNTIADSAGAEGILIRESSGTNCLTFMNNQSPTDIFLINVGGSVTLHRVPPSGNLPIPTFIGTGTIYNVVSCP